MTDLIIQHPELADDAVAAFAGAVGRAPDRREAALAAWRGAAMDRPSVDRLADAQQVDAALVAQGARLADYRLAAFDMDSTLITIECVDEIADYVGRKAEVAAITEAAMRGEIADYDESLRQRVALLEGLEESTLQRVWDERVALTPGVERLFAGLKASGLKILLVSGGFTFFTGRVAALVGFHEHHSNTLLEADGQLTGHVADPILGRNAKLATLKRLAAEAGIGLDATLAVGDGANDLDMIQAAGLGVAYHAKPVVAAAARARVEHGDLRALLFAQGYRGGDIVAA